MSAVGVDGSRRRPLAALSVRLGVWVVVVAVVAVGDPAPTVGLLLVALAGVVTITSDARFAVERRLDAAGCPSRELWVPVVVVLVAARLDLVDLGGLGTGLADRWPVIVVVLGFAVLTEGLRRSGFFEYVAHWMVQLGGGSVPRLTIHLFLLSAAVAYLSSKEIGVLATTPLALAVVRHARLGNAKLLLLSQLLAVGTAPAGVAAGSFVSLSLLAPAGLPLVGRLVLLAAPSLVALMATLVVVSAVGRLAERTTRGEGTLSSWASPTVYRPPRSSGYRSLTPEMLGWVVLLVASTVAVAVGQGTPDGLALASVAVAVVGVAALFRAERRWGSPTSLPAFVGLTAWAVPLAVVPVGLGFLVVADALHDQSGDVAATSDVVEEVADRDPTMTSVSATYSSGALAALTGEMPAATLGGDLLDDAEHATAFDEALLTLGALMGASLGGLVTPASGLAVVAWFALVQKDRDREPGSGADGGPELVTPSRRDVVVFGSVSFVVTAFVIATTNVGLVAFADLAVGPIDGQAVFVSRLRGSWWPVLSTVVLMGTVVAFQRVVERAGVSLTNASDLVPVVTRVRLWIARHPGMTAVMAFMTVYGLSAVVLYDVETAHAHLYDRPVLFESVGQVGVWLVVFASSGFEGDVFPRSALGYFLPVALLVTVVVVVPELFWRTVRRQQVPETATTRWRLTQRIARGEIHGDRTVVINATLDDAATLHGLATRSDRFLSVVTADERLDTWLDTLGPIGLRRAATLAPPAIPGHLIGGLRLDRAREIVLLSRSAADDLENLRALAALDAATRTGTDPEVTPGSDALPAVVLETHSGMSQVLTDVLSPGLRAVIARPPFESVIRPLVVAIASGDRARTRAFYLDPPLTELAGLDDLADTAVAPHVGVTGDRLLLDTRPGLPDGDYSLTTVAVEVDMGDRRMWRHLPAHRNAGIDATITSTVTVESAPDQLPPTSRTGPLANAHAKVWVVGSGPLAQRCALDLANSGVEDVELIVGPHSLLLDEVAAAEAVSATRCDDELHVVATLRRQRASDEAILVFDEHHQGAFVAEQLLETLCEERWQRAIDHADHSTIYVCCRGPERAEKLSSGALDKVIDISSVQTSYFTALSTVYLDVLPASDLGWSTERSLAVAHHIAARLCHLDLQRPDDNWLVHPTHGLVNAALLPVSEIMRTDGSSPIGPGGMIGLVTFSVHDDSVHADLRVPPDDDDTPVMPTDLLFGLRHV